MHTLVAPIDYEAARFAVEHWHYSGKIPSGKLVKFGVWEGGDFIGAIVYGRGASPYLGHAYDLDQTKLCELVRVALRSHDRPVTQHVAESLRLLSASNPGLRLVVSFADSKEGHLGTIYQAGNWVYTGESTTDYIRVGGELLHFRSFGERYGPEYGPGRLSIEWIREHVDPNAELVRQLPKHRYLYPLDRAMRRQIAPLALPYPTRGQGLEGETSGSRPEGAGSTPAVRSEE